ncbi:MAG: peptidoglycan-binding protein [Acetobacterium sp.]|nr:peptidoglycan-binding protein [Acetobacterium sp.]
MSADVKWIQEHLQALGYEPGPVDGEVGDCTDAAIRLFQKENDLAVDGQVGERTHSALIQARSRIGLKVDQDGKLLLKDFTKDEFTCECGCGLDVCDRLKAFAQRLRDQFGWPLVISSGARCPTVNAAVGGVPDSCHLTGHAFDGYFPGQMNEAVMAQMADYAISQEIGVIRYPNQLFCHFQIPPRNQIID